MRNPELHWREPATPIAHETLRFADESVPQDLSAVARAGDTLFLGADESAHIEILHRQADGSWGEHERQPLGALFALPDDADELDIEGLHVDGGCLWIVGSHSRTRKKLKKGKAATSQSLARLQTIEDKPNRAFLGSVGLAERDGGRHGIKAERGRMLSIRSGEDAVLRRLADDPVLAPFIAIPAKENGLDVEGIAVHGARVSLGLRGPVVGGWACIIDLALRDGGAFGLKIDGGLVHHWVDLDGLGVRDLKRDGDDLLILAGPSLAVSGPSAVYRWSDWVRAAPAPSVQIPTLECVLPWGYRCEHPEALLPWRDAGVPRLLVLCDSPHPRRVDGGRIVVDVFTLAE